MQKYIKFITGPDSARIAAIIGVVVLLLDFVTKALVVRYLDVNTSVSVIYGFNIAHVRNYGFTLGILHDILSPFVIAGVSMFAVFLLMIWVQYNREFKSLVLLVIFGALGNVIDRFKYGCVIDFIDLYIGGWHWPAFNIADCAIVVGNLSYLLTILWNNGKIYHRKKY